MIISPERFFLLDLMISKSLIIKEALKAQELSKELPVFFSNEDFEDLLTWPESAIQKAALSLANPDLCHTDYYTCPWCRRSQCFTCTYEIRHGVCTEPNSTYQRILQELSSSSNSLTDLSGMKESIQACQERYLYPTYNPKAVQSLITILPNKILTVQQTRSLPYHPTIYTLDLFNPTDWLHLLEGYCFRIQGTTEYIEPVPNSTQKVYTELKFRES